MRPLFPSVRGPHLSRISYSKTTRTVSRKAPKAYAPLNAWIRANTSPDEVIAFALDPNVHWEHRQRALWLVETEGPPVGVIYAVAPPGVALWDPDADPAEEDPEL